MLVHREMSKKEGCRLSDPGCVFPSQFTSVLLRSLYAGIFQTIHLLSPSLNRENTHAPPAMLDLFYVWTSEHEHLQFLVIFDIPHAASNVYLLGYDKR